MIDSLLQASPRGASRLADARAVGGGVRQFGSDPEITRVSWAGSTRRFRRRARSARSERHSTQMSAREDERRAEPPAEQLKRSPPNAIANTGEHGLEREQQSDASRAQRAQCQNLK